MIISAERRSRQDSPGTDPRPTLVLLSPIVPAQTGNGLAMRAGMQLEALGRAFDIRLVVVPVAGGTTDLTWASTHASSVHVVASDDIARLRRGAMHLMAHPRWRERLGRTEPLPELARRAGPALVDAVVAAVAVESVPVHAIRSYLAPLAVAVAERCRAPWSTLDLDDDDERLLLELGRPDEAAAYTRLLRGFAGDFRWVALSAPAEAAAVGERHDLTTVVVPNGVSVRAPLLPGPRSTCRPLTMLLVSNLTYEPNVTAAERLVHGVLPRVRRLLGEKVVAELVGAFEPGGPIEALGLVEDVHLTGYVEDLGSVYERAALVVVPIRHGAGTRIKVLEALSYGLPVVTSPAGAAGLGVRDGVHLLVAESDAEIAAAIARVAGDVALANSLGRRGHMLVASQFDREAIGRRLVALMPTG